MMAMLVFVYLPTFSQHVLTKANALMRSGDAMHKQLVAYVPPGESGMNATWDFRNIDVLSDSYSIEYVKDSDSCLYAQRQLDVPNCRGDTQRLLCLA